MTRELMAMAAEDAARIEARQQELLAEIERILDKDKEEESKPKAIVLEFRAGAGGDEATLFAQELKEMYQKYGEGKGWHVKVLDDLTLEIEGADAWEALRYETGVHRVQRVPVTRRPDTYPIRRLPQLRHFLFVRSQRSSSIPQISKWNLSQRRGRRTECEQGGECCAHHT